MLEHVEEAAGGVDVVGDEDGVAVATLQARTCLHVEEDVAHDLGEAVARAEDLLHGAPALFELGQGVVGETTGLGLEPLIDLGLRGDALVDVAGFVAQVEDDTVAHSFVVFVGVDVGAEDFDAGAFVALEQGRAGEADEGGVGQQRLHGLVQLARLGAVTFVDEDEDLTFGAEVGGQAAP